MWWVRSPSTSPTSWAPAPSASRFRRSSNGITRSAANIDKSWIDAPAEKIFEERLGRDITLVNDADAAGIAEVRWGAAGKQPGLVIVTTLGTGIGSALIYNGVLIPNSELGHIEIDGHDAGTWASAAVREREGMTHEDWATERLQRYYETIEFLFSRPTGRGRRRLEEVEEVPAAAEAQDADRPGEAAQRRRHRRCRLARC